jgi:hypothetical protein
MVLTPREEGTTVFTDGQIAGVVIGSLIGGGAVGVLALVLFLRKKGDVRVSRKTYSGKTELPPLPH